jgi:hypothetical protein
LSKRKKMPVAEKPRKKRVFIASSQADAGQLRKAMEHFDLDAVTLEQADTPGTTWVESLHRCVDDADLVIGIMGDRRKAFNVVFELGIASALNKPTLLFITPDYPIELVPPSGIPYLRMDLRNEDAVTFGLNQALALTPRDRLLRSAEGFKTRPIGSAADELVAKLERTSETELEDLIYEALKASGAPTIARGRKVEDTEVDFAVWSSDLEPAIANPLLIECKLNLHNQGDVDQLIGRMIRALRPIPNGCGLVLYREAGRVVIVPPQFVAIHFLSAEEFLNGLRDVGLAKYVRSLVNGAVHGL